MSAHAKPQDIVFFIDKQKFTVEEGRQYTVRDLLVLAGENPEETTLVIRHGKDIIKLTDLDAVVEIKNGMHFAVFHNTPTPVS